MSTEHASPRPAAFLTERQRIEASYYDRRALEHEGILSVSDGDLQIDPSVPPFPNHEHEDFLTRALEGLGDVRGTRVLEVGCGSGTIGVYLALRGAASVVGVDVSDATLRIAERRAIVNGVADRVAFRAIPVEAIDEPDASFDRIIGNQVLHHFDLPTAMPTLRQLLRPGGRAVFCEPVLLIPEVFRSIRDSRVFTRMFPRRVDTPTERSLSQADIDLICHELPGAQIYSFQLFTRLQNFVSLSEQWFIRLSALDRLVLRYVPPARALCRFVVVEFNPTGEPHVD